MSNRDYADLAALALAQIADHSCPICGERKWKTIPLAIALHIEGEKNRARSVPIVCGDCGHINLFMCSYLEKKAQKLHAGTNGH
jgi:hypothetical protein